MMKIESQLGTTAHCIVVDLDAQYVSYGPDSDEVHCWTCGSADEMAAGAFLVPGKHTDARLSWEDGARYEQPPVPAYMTETRTKTVVCCTCALRLGFPNAKHLETTAQRAERLAAKHGLN